MEFVHPFPGKNPGDKLTKQELISAVRLALCAEEEAVHLYDTIAEYTNDEKVKKIMKDVADEEQVHIGEFQKLLDLLEEDEVEKVEEGEKEAEEKMEDIFHIAGMIDEDPDVLSEDYCPACGGWDKEQGGVGHRLGCPVGKPGTPIKWTSRPPKPGLLGFAVPDDFIIDYIYEYWGKSAIAMTLMDALNYEGAALSPDDEHGDVKTAILSNIQTSQDVVRNFIDEIVDAYNAA